MVLCRLKAEVGWRWDLQQQDYGVSSVAGLRAQWKMVSQSNDHNSAQTDQGDADVPLARISG
jgi:hypothetical protein